ncbi:hypothetical protein BN946_scf184649.g30 [Trametes cinnabarina]|uniref:thioredoxin-dependent peroxiredoxin n=1 Tax=Pycnoporus cinnabarinus TaxID=5643 RepID=A0A060SV52_PYCCI|nr:hypothetical protein BN946_scf184649.g30 [Trametes cinnabarina]
MARHPLIDKPAPTISLPGADGETHTVTPGAKGVPTVLFFYPKSVDADQLLGVRATGTYGCTKEACQFRDALDKDNTFKEAGVEVVGISPDPVDKQKEFVDKHKLTYPILSDAKGEARKAYHVGKGLFGLAESARVTFIIDSKGTVRDVLDTTLNYGAHVKFVTNWLRKNRSKTDAEAPGTTEDAPAAGETSASATPAPTTPNATVPEGQTAAELGRAAEAVQA